MKRALQTRSSRRRGAARSAPSLAAQTVVPEIAFDANADLLKLPDNIHLGEVAGVATNSKGHIFVYTRTGSRERDARHVAHVLHGGSRLFEFDQTGKFVREIGRASTASSSRRRCASIRRTTSGSSIEGSTQVIKFDPDGRVQLVLSRKPEAIAVRAGAPGAGRGAAPKDAAARRPEAARRARRAAAARRRRGGGGRGRPDRRRRHSRRQLQPPADVAWDAQGNIYVADGYGNGRQRARREVRQGRPLHQVVGLSAAPSRASSTSLHGIAIDAQGNVYVADARQQAHPGVRQRRQLQDADRERRHAVGDLHHAGRAPVPLQSRTRTIAETLDNGEIYKMELDGKIVGKFGRAGKLLKEFGMVNAIDCRSENELLVGELANWRVQKLTLHPAK